MPTPRDWVNDLQMCLVGGEEHLIERIPALVEGCIKDRLWANARDKKGQPFPTFESFVGYPLWWGLESTVEDLLAYCRKSQSAQQAIRAEITPAGEHGTNQWTNGRNNITSRRGTAETYTLARLKRDRPDLAEQVVAGTLTANAAAIQAGFRKRMVSVPATDLPAAMRILAKHYDPADMAIAAARLRHA